MPSFRELLAATKSQIREIDTAAADELRRRPGAVVLDVREPDEYEQGAIPGAVHIPRGTLEGSVENRIPDKSAPVIVHCASGVRSAFAARTLAEMGYEDVVSMVGGFNKWKDEGRDWSTPRRLTAEQRNRYQRHLLLPEVDVEGQLKLLDARVLLLGAGGLGSPAALYLAAAGVGTIGIVDMDVVDESNLQRQILHNVDRIGERKVDSAKKTLTALNPDVNVVTHDVRLGADNVMDILSGYDIVIDGADNFPVRYLLNDAALKLGIPVVHGSIFRFEGQVTVFTPHDGPVLPVLPARAPAARAGAVLRRGRRAGRAAGHRRFDPGGRGDQAHPRHRRQPVGPSAGLRLAGAVVPHLQDAARPAVPGLLDRPRADRHRRVRRALRPAPDPAAGRLAAPHPLGRARRRGAAVGYSTTDAHRRRSRWGATGPRRAGPAADGAGSATDHRRRLRARLPARRPLRDLVPAVGHRGRGAARRLRVEALLRPRDAHDRRPARPVHHRLGGVDRQVGRLRLLPAAGIHTRDNGHGGLVLRGVPPAPSLPGARRGRAAVRRPGARRHVRAPGGDRRRRRADMRAHGPARLDLVRPPAAPHGPPRWRPAPPPPCCRRSPTPAAGSTATSSPPCASWPGRCWCSGGSTGPPPVGPWPSAVCWRRRP